MTSLWKDEFLTGVKDIDDQHKKLATFVDRLDELAKQPKIDFREVRRAIILLGTYTRAHISYEEDWGIRYNCQFDEQHKKMNQRFLSFYQTLKNKSEEKGIDKEVLEMLYVPAKAWLTDHMSTTNHIICEAASLGISNLQVPTVTSKPYLAN